MSKQKKTNRSKEMAIDWLSTPTPDPAPEIVVTNTSPPRKKKYMSPTEMMVHFQAFRVERKATPFQIQDFGATKDGIEKVSIDKEKPLTMSGFELYLFEKGIINDIGHILANRDGAYSAYIPIIALIKKYIEDDQVTGAMGGIYNANLTARINSISEKSETKNINVNFDIEMDLS
jgi:hypothetical protein